MTPLEMAVNAAKNVERFAAFEHEDQFGAYIARTGQRGHDAAQLAANLALVSIAQDIHRIAEAVVRQAAEDDEFTESGPPLRSPSEPPPQKGTRDDGKG